MRSLTVLTCLIAAVPAPSGADTLLDLAANGPRWHLYDRGLVVPVADAGLAKYDLGDRSTWGAVREVDGRRGRELRGGRAELTVPWDNGGPVKVWVRARGTRRVAVRIDGRLLGRAALEPGWTEVALDGPELAPGEHRLVLETEGRDALVHDVELARADAAPCAPSWPALSALVGGELGGWRRAALVTELPRAAWLVVKPTGGGVGRITVTPLGAAPAELWSGDLDGTPRRLSLAAFSGQLVRLELEADRCGDARWAAATVARAEAEPAARPAPARNVILVVVDSLRADRIAAVGPTRVETPRLTAAARARGLVYPRNQAMAPSSPPSHATIHTGQIPRVHGVAGDTGNLRADTPILSAIFAGAGFFTGYVGNNGFAMDRFRKPARWDEFHTPNQEGQGIDCAPIVRRGLAMAQRAAADGKRFFLTLLPIEPHEPYIYHRGTTEKYFPGPFDPPIGKSFGDLEHIHQLPMTARSWDQLRGLYDGAVEHFDGCFGALEDGLASLGLDTSTAIVVASDHGEGLGERGGRVGHAYSLHDELLHVPLVILGSGRAPATVDVVTSNLAIAPTVLDLVGLPPDPRMQGASLLALDDSMPRMVVSEYGRSYALRAGPWHYLVDYDGVETLFDVSVDKQEIHDLAASAPLVLRYFRDAAGLYLAHRTAWREATWGALNALLPGAGVH
jgi:arylsulfatase A-like enzyme